MRTLGYRDAIEGNTALIKGKTVLDVGCGTGVLSMMCVRAGAAHVIAIDASDIVDHAKRIVAANKMSDKITVIRGTMETLKLPAGVTKVDVRMPHTVHCCPKGRTAKERTALKSTPT